MPLPYYFCWNKLLFLMYLSCLLYLVCDLVPCFIWWSQSTSDLLACLPWTAVLIMPNPLLPCSILFVIWFLVLFVLLLSKTRKILLFKCAVPLIERYLASKTWLFLFLHILIIDYLASKVCVLFVFSWRL